MIVGVTWLLPLVLMLLLKPKPLLGPAGDVLLFWPRPSSFQTFVAQSGMVVAALTAALSFRLDRLRWWIWTPAAVVAAGAILTGVPATQASVDLTSEAIVIRDGWPRAGTRTYPLSAVTGLQANCGSVRANSRSSTAALDYVVTLEGGEQIHLIEAMPGRSSFAVSQWLRAVDRWDRLPGLTAERTGSASPECLDRLRAELAPAEFAVATRLLRAPQA